MKNGKIAKKIQNPVLEAGTVPHFEICGSKEILADGCLGILHYDEEKVSLNCGEEIIEVFGSGLTLHHLGEEEAMVRGRISMVKFL